MKRKEKEHEERDGRKEEEKDGNPRPMLGRDSEEVMGTLRTLFTSLRAPLIFPKSPPDLTAAFLLLSSSTLGSTAQNWTMGRQ